MTIPTDYDWSRWTPIDSTGTDYSVFTSAYKNIRFAIPTSTTYTLMAGDEGNLAGIAYKLYGDTSLWRALLHFNGWNDPIDDVRPGRTLNVPAKSDIIAYLSSQQSNTAPVTIFI